MFLSALRDRWTYLWVLLSSSSVLLLLYGVWGLLFVVRVCLVVQNKLSIYGQDILSAGDTPTTGTTRYGLCSSYLHI